MLNSAWPACAVTTYPERRQYSSTCIEHSAKPIYHSRHLNAAQIAAVAKILKMPKRENQGKSQPEQRDRRDGLAEVMEMETRPDDNALEDRRRWMALADSVLGKSTTTKKVKSS